MATVEVVRALPIADVTCDTHPLRRSIPQTDSNMAKSVRLLKRQIRKEIEQALPTLSDSMIAEECNFPVAIVINDQQTYAQRHCSIFLNSFRAKTSQYTYRWPLENYRLSP